MERTWIIVNTTHYGNGWEHSFNSIFDTEEEAEQFTEQHRKKMDSVDGIERVSFNQFEKTEEGMRSIFTVDEYCSFFPEFEKAVDDFFRGRRINGL